MDDEQGRTSHPATDGITITGNGEDGPGIVTPVSPSGTIDTRTPACTWQSVAKSTRYVPSVNDGKGARNVNVLFSVDTGNIAPVVTAGYLAHPDTGGAYKKA